MRQRYKVAAQKGTCNNKKIPEIRVTMHMPQPTEQERFLGDLTPKGSDFFEQPEGVEDPAIPGPTGATGPTGEGEDPEVPDDVKNRRHKRLEAKLQAEREANIKMAARLEAVTEAQRARAENEPSEYLKMVEKIYGTNSPEAKEATELLAQAFQGVEERAAKRALETFREEQRQQQEAVKREEAELGQMIEDIEDQFDTELTPAMKKGFFAELEKLSPKDEQGNIIHYADPLAVWEIYSSRATKAPVNPAKKLSSRSMTPSGASPESKLTEDVNFRYLRDIGII